MDYIKKTICIEGARTRTQGLMPYYEFGKAYTQHSGSSCHTMSELDLESASGDNGNWGQMVANPCFLADKDKTYEAMLRKYYDLLNMVRSGVKLRKVETKDGKVIFTEDVGAFEWNGQCFEGGEEPETLYAYAAYDADDFSFTEIDSLRDETRRIYRTSGSVSEDYIVLISDYDKFQGLASYLDGVSLPSSVTSHRIGSYEHTKWVDYCMVVDDMIGRINIPASIYNKHIKVPKTMPCADVNSYIDWLENYQTLSADCCNMRLWDDMGGTDMLNFLNQHKNECQRKLNALNNLTYAVPYIEMPVLLTQNTTDVGVLTNIDGVDYDGSLDETERPFGPAHYENKMGVCALTIDQIVMGTGITQDGIEVESLLNTLRCPKKYTDDKDNVLPGLFQKFPNPAGEMYVCVKKSDEVFYRMEVSAHTVVSGEVIDYCVKYVQDNGMTPATFSAHCDNDNIVQSLNKIFAGHKTLEDANQIVADELAKYNSYDQTNRYEMCEADPVWEMEPLPSCEPKNSKNGDGKQSEEVKYLPDEDPQYEDATNKYYRTITTQESGIRIAVTEEEEASTRENYGHDYKDPFKTHYYFFVKYNNSPSSPMTVPYKIGNTTNVYLVSDDNGYIYRGDFITDSGTTQESGVTYVWFKYVVGGYFVGDSAGTYSRYYGGGDVYYEKHVLDTSHVDLVALDGVDNVPVYSYYIDFEADAKEFYSPRYNLYRTGNTATIIKMTTGEVWNKDFAYDAYLTKEDYLTNFSLPPKVDVNVTIDRGGASAFERHYKLAECNTMQDLVNYGNNFFNL